MEATNFSCGKKSDKDHILHKRATHFPVDQLDDLAFGAEKFVAERCGLDLKEQDVVFNVNLLGTAGDRRTHDLVPMRDYVGLVETVTELVPIEHLIDSLFQRRNSWPSGRFFLVKPIIHFITLFVNVQR